MRKILYLSLLILFISMVDAYPYFWDFPQYIKENKKDEIVTDFKVVEGSDQYFIFFLTRRKTHSAIILFKTGDFIKYKGPFQVEGRIGVAKDFYPQFDVISNDGILYCVWNNLDGSIFFKKSEDGAESWTEDMEVVKPGEISFQPKLFSTDEVLLISFHAESEGRRIDYFYMLSEDKGDTWSGPYKVAMELGGSFFPSFAMDSENYLVAWQSRPLREDIDVNTPPDFDIYLSRTKDLKLPWPKPSNITLNPAGEDVMPLLELSEGKIKLYWECDIDGLWGIYYREYNLQGIAISDVLRVSSPIFNAHDPGIVHPGDRTLVFFVEVRGGKRKLVYSEKVGDRFKEADPVSVIDPDVLSYFPFVRGEELHLVYLDGNGVAHIGPDRGVPAPIPVSGKQEYIGLHGASVSWEQPPDSSGIEGYCYVFDKDEKIIPEIVNLPSTSRSLRIFSAEEGVYYLHLRAKDLAGNYSKTVTITYISDLTPPGTLTIIPPSVDAEGYIESDSALIRWTGGGDDVAGYTFNLSKEETSELPGKIITEETSVQFKALKEGVWHFKVAAIDRAGNTGDVSHLSFGVKPFKPAGGFEVTREAGKKLKVKLPRFSIFLGLLSGKKLLKPILFVCVSGVICFGLCCFFTRLYGRRVEKAGGKPMRERGEVSIPGGKRMGLRFKFSLLFGGLVLAIALGMSSVLSMVTINHEKKVLAGQMMDKALLSLDNMSGIAREGILNDDELLLYSVITKMMENEDIEYAIILNREGVVIAHSDIQERGKKYTDPFTIRALQAEGVLVEPEFSPQLIASRYELSSPVTFAGTRIGTVRLGYGTRSISSALKELRHSTILNTILITIVIVIFGVGVAFVMATITIKPVKVLARGANIIGGGNLEHRIHIRARDELGLLADEFNRMTERLRIYQKEVEKKAKIEEQLEIARKIQQDLIPGAGIERPEFSIDGYYRAAAHVGGDYYDFMEVSGEEYGLIISDVAGKGVPASLTMIMIRTLFKSLMRSGISDPAQVLTLINTTLTPDIGDGRFATILFGAFNRKKRVFRYANAGYGPILVYRASEGECTFISSPGQSIPIGIMTDVSFGEEKPLRFKKGDILLLFTDGIYEARNKNGEEYGMDRLAEVVRGVSGRKSAEIASRVVKSVLSFTGEVEQQDDMTLLVMKVH